ncbi:UDP-glucuronate 4-epimerase [Azospirillum lipoferum]|uniref:SDR family NAD(P)-dependent oxidoreductase n=1 Tax=Azospirillum lipoferum TaxID=193 RepID=A0A5A9GXE2_AZOLI|nr:MULTISPECIES: NAD-dependent epimerase/dehydratase family protein [Azospirillum]KAA0598244.1 SDR family NAD(P)-dependent oxidoreductase [Azospirillum lipoferum]MCP1609775.1 UDP-glucuronate 4-epimerase [Azospirillum lipoferum]MDW5534920.1 SDR family NAD(P)-dependent oxidoreductase [Azospirillum sp. NL1]
MTILVTGAAGFIGSHVAAALLDRGESVLGLDNLNDYYAVALKEARLARLTGRSGFRFIRADISDRKTVEGLWPQFADVTGVVHLAAQPGVRYSIENPYAYVDANVTGQVTLLEAARRMPGLRHFVYASTSSVYGANRKMPFSVEDRVDSPVSVYAATKKAAEMLAFTYSHLYQMPMTGLRFFTVYGPWSRPDMATWLFADAITAGRPIRVFNGGLMKRDFTYIDDIVAGVLAALDRPAPVDAGTGAPHRVFNLGNNRCEELMRFIGVLEQAMGREAVKVMEPMQAGDVPETAADIELSRQVLGFEPKTPIEIGLPRFVEWYKGYHKL